MVSVIIRNHNESEYIGFAIQSVIDHVKDPEIIVVNNNSSDDSLDVVKLFNDRVKIKILDIQDYTPGRSINLGVQNSTHKTILVLSGHSQITKMNLSEVEKSLKKYVAVFGQQIPIYRGKKISRRYIWSHFKDQCTIENMFSQIEDRNFLHNAFCFYKKDFLVKNPFDETLSGKEDRYWAINIVEKGLSYLYDSKNMVCNHYYTSNGATWKGLG